MLAKFSLVTLNIECDEHLDTVTDFLTTHQPDVIVLQEVLSKDLAELEKKLGIHSVFAPLNFLCRGESIDKLGVAIFSKQPFIKTEAIYYSGDGDNLAYITSEEPEKMARTVLIAYVEINQQQVCVVNTHFTWTPNGAPNQQQFLDCQKMLDILAGLSEHVLCGDFNAPRGTAIFDILAGKYKDNIPANILSTLDKNLHKAGHLQLVVDGIFTTPQYQVTDLQVIPGVSDHCAILAEINLTSK